MHFTINLAAVIAASVLLLFSGVAIFRCPARFFRQAAYASYGLMVFISFTLMINTGELDSGYVPIWTSLMFLGSAIHPLIALIGPFVASGYLAFLWVERTLTLDSIAFVVVMSVVPSILGWIIWGRNKDMFAVSEHSNKYHALAAELSQVAGKSEVVINAIDDGVLALDTNGSIELINPAAQKMIGWGKQDALGLNYTSVLKIVDGEGKALSPLQHPIQQVLNSNMQVTSEVYRLLTSSEKTIQIALVVSPISQQNTGVIVVFRDITKAKQEEREQAEFISTASHEMRTPVAAIEGYLGLALNPATATIDAKAREFIEKAQSAATHLGHLFQDLLDVSKADDKRLIQNPRLIDATALVGEIVQGFAAKAAEKQLALNFPPAAAHADKSAPLLGGRQINPVYYLHLDKDHFREVVANLVENAVKYTPQGSVTVNIEGNNEKIHISIADTGIGIPKEDVGHLFQKFYRIDNSETREIGGTGLGLYLCRRLTEEMGGRIWVESEYSKGSTFHLEFPRIDHQTAEEIRAKEAQEDAKEVAKSAPAASQTTPSIPPGTSPELSVSPAPESPQPTPVIQTSAPTPPVDPTRSVQSPPVPPEQPPINHQVSTAPTASAQQQPVAPEQPTAPPPVANSQSDIAPAQPPVVATPPAAAPRSIPVVSAPAPPPPPQPHVQPINISIPTPSTDRTNTPLSELEAHREQYAQQRIDNVIVPPRNP